MLALPAIRLATPTDAPAIARASRDSIEHDLSWSWTETRVIQAIRDASTNVSIAASRECLHGFGIMQYLDDDAHLVAIVPTMRHQGLGRRLLAWLEGSAVTAGLATVRLECRADNLNAIAFYQRLGYRHVGAVPGYYEGRIDAVQMGKRLQRARA